MDERIEQFYALLLPRLKESVFREGEWRLLNCTTAWQGNESWDGFVAFAWTGGNNERRLVVVNYSDHYSQCYVRLPWQDLPGNTWCLRDQMSSASYDRDGQDLSALGLYLDIAPWRYHVFDLHPVFVPYEEREELAGSIRG